MPPSHSVHCRAGHHTLQWRTMRAYIEGLLAAGAVRVVEREVSGRHELASVVAASQRESDAPVLFRRVAGSEHPAVSNVFGSRKRLTAMLGGDTSFCRQWVERMRAPALPPLCIDEPANLRELRLTALPQ
ncbi:MAG: UbiD family decarboxylase, partial [Acetobacteraceae bacterium]|nr:UbiD family decarboxylase [Acetobacteraceae bacterium]